MIHCVQAAEGLNTHDEKTHLLRSLWLFDDHDKAG
jgi:hypothetical protein